MTVALSVEAGIATRAEKNHAPPFSFGLDDEVEKVADRRLVDELDSTLVDQPVA